MSGVSNFGGNFILLRRVGTSSKSISLTEISGGTAHCKENEARGARFPPWKRKPWKGGLLLLPPSLSLSLSIYRRNWAVSMQFSRLRPRSIRDTPRAPPLRSSSTRKNKIFLGARKSAEPPVSRRLRSSHPTMTVPFHRNSAASLEEKLFALLSLIMLPRKRYLLLLGRERGHPVSRSIN